MTPQNLNFDRKQYQPGTAKHELLKVFSKGGKWAIHEIRDRYKAITGVFLAYSENCIATRLSELERDGHLKSEFRDNKNFKEWSSR